MRKGIAISATALAALAVTAAPANANSWGDVPPPDKVTIKVINLNGSGCPKDSATAVVSPDREAFTIAYSAYTVQAGGNIPPIEARKNCLITLTVLVPGGFTYAVASTDHRGYADLQPGAIASQGASYWFQGHSQTTLTQHSIPVDSTNWQFTDKVSIPNLIYRPCGEDRYFIINTELGVRAGTDKSKISLLALDSTDGSIKTTYHFAWKKC
ncbi:DUF4360 domain-containing protein [Actinomadura terrae]|uniref:DUF4360 domain-containing protein n=1 Tax=Actinomadura terrae TaxID=604353 RepID=UPI001FA72D3F|nr:DUF4360 domain-containing protein [Actinomadura terrae]